MRRRLDPWLLAAAVLFCAAPALAWDGVTHRRLTEEAVEDVRTPELRAFLLAHRDALISGGDFPDWGHAFKPQGEADHSFYLDAASAYLARPDVKAQANYPDLLAHYLGAYAHVVEDRVVDATLKRHARAVGEGRRDDMENGMMEIAAQGWLVRDYNLYVPYADEARIYREAHYFDDPRLNAGNFTAIMKRSIERGDVMERRLKLLSFLTAGYSRRIFPWGAANVPTAPGGFESNRRAVAAGWEAIWAEVHGRPAPFFVYSLPADGETIASDDPTTSYGRITVVTRRRFDMRRLPTADVQLVDATGQAIPVRVLPYIEEPNLYPYRPEPGHDIDVAFQIQPLRRLAPGGRYSLALLPGDYAPGAGPIAPYRIAFSVPTHPLYQARIQAPRPWAMGLFLFAFVGSVAGLAWGIPDVVRLARTPKGAGAVADPLAFKTFDLLFKAVAAALGVLALWLLFTDGAAFTEFLRHHH